jgi:hypothetical protein
MVKKLWNSLVNEVKGWTWKDLFRAYIIFVLGKILLRVLNYG